MKKSKDRMEWRYYELKFKFDAKYAKKIGKIIDDFEKKLNKKIKKGLK